MLNKKNKCYIEEFIDRNNYFQQGIMEEVTSDLRKKWEWFQWILSQTKEETWERHTERENTRHIQMHTVHLHAVQENVLRDTEKNLNPACSLVLVGVWLGDKQGLVSPLLTKPTGSEAQNTKTWESS